MKKLLLSVGIGLVIFSYATAQPYQVEWGDKSSSVIDGIDYLTTAGGGGYIKAMSSNILGAGVEGEFQFRIQDRNSTEYRIGFVSSSFTFNADQSIVQFPNVYLRIDGNNAVFRYDSLGVRSILTDYLTYVNGDLITFKRTSTGNVEFYHNGQLVPILSGQEQKLQGLTGGMKIFSYMANQPHILHLNASFGSISISPFQAPQLQNWNYSVDGFNSFTNGKVGIGWNGLNSGSHSLYVSNGGVRTVKLQIDIEDVWPDYVFASGYQLPTLDQIEQFITEHGHLEGFPSAREIAEDNAIDLAEMLTSLTRKVEELQLLIIEQEKELGELKKLD